MTIIFSNSLTLLFWGWGFILSSTEIYSINIKFLLDIIASYLHKLNLIKSERTCTESKIVY